MAAAAPAEVVAPTSYGAVGGTCVAVTVATVAPTAAVRDSPAAVAVGEDVAVVDLSALPQQPGGARRSRGGGAETVPDHGADAAAARGGRTAAAAAATAAGGGGGGWYGGRPRPPHDLTMLLYGSVWAGVTVKDIVLSDSWVFCLVMLPVLGMALSFARLGLASLRAAADAAAAAADAAAGAAAAPLLPHENRCGDAVRSAGSTTGGGSQAGGGAPRGDAAGARLAGRGLLVTGIIGAVQVSTIPLLLAGGLPPTFDLMMMVFVATGVAGSLAAALTGWRAVRAANEGAYDGTPIADGDGVEMTAASAVAGPTAGRLLWGHPRRWGGVWGTRVPAGLPAAPV